jgi:hypothetical protein
VRLLEEDARWIYSWSDQWVPGRGSKVKVYGTPVLVFGDYAYGQPAPWLGLTTGDSAATISSTELAEALGPNLALITERRGEYAWQWQAFLSMGGRKTIACSAQRGPSLTALPRRAVREITIHDPALSSCSCRAPPRESPRLVVATALVAVEGDSSRVLAERWARRLAADSSDRAARLGLATIDRLEYRYARAYSQYAALEDSSDDYALYAGLGRIWGELLRGPFDSTMFRALDLATRARAANDSAAAVEALGIAGFLASRLGALPQALDTLSVAERLVPAGHQWLRALVLCARAPILSFGGRPDAWATGQRGLALAHQSGVKRVVGQCYQSLSIVAINDVDDPALPEAYADSAEVMQLAARDGAMLAVTTFNRGYKRWLSDLAEPRR